MTERADELQGRSEAPAARHRPAERRRGGAGRRILVIYGVLALAVFAFPGGLVEWLDNRNDSGWLTAPLAAMRAVDAASASLGVKAVGQALRKRFAAAFSGDDDQ